MSETRTETRTCPECGCADVQMHGRVLGYHDGLPPTRMLCPASMRAELCPGCDGGGCMTCEGYGWVERTP